MIARPKLSRIGRFDRPGGENRAEDGESWHLTFADLMALLLCFFILMVSVSSMDQKKFQDMTGKLAKAMGGDKQVIDKESRRQARLDLIEFQLNRKLRAPVEAGRIAIDRLPRGVAVDIKGGLLFNSASAELKEDALGLLADIAAQMTGAGIRLVIEGHTDDQAIHTDRYPSNWELSSARAASVARFMDDHGVDRRRITIVGYADAKPLVPNSDEIGRAKNRRVRLVITDGPSLQ